MNKHKKHYCALALFVAAELIVSCTCTFTFNQKRALIFVHIILNNFYFIVKGYKLVPFFKKNYPELYEKYPDIRFELTAAGFASTLSKAGEKMDDVLKAEAREILVIQITLFVLALLWQIPFHLII